jgi:hypothetical protein
MSREANDQEEAKRWVYERIVELAEHDPAVEAAKAVVDYHVEATHAADDVDDILDQGDVPDYLGLIEDLPERASVEFWCGDDGTNGPDYDCDIHTKFLKAVETLAQKMSSIRT